MTTDGHKTGILLFAHGSSMEEANRAVHELARQIQETGPYDYVRTAFLELAHPNLESALTQAVDAGLRRIIVIPYFLTTGIHLQRDLPSLVAPQKEKFPDVEIVVGRALEGHPLVVSIILERVREAMGETKAF